MTFLRLLLALCSLTGLPESTARQHVEAAFAVATKHAPPDLMLAIAYHETAGSLNPHALGCAGVKGGVWTSDKPPRGTKVWCCGVTQVATRNWQQCLALRDTRTAYTQGHAVLSSWLRSCRGSMTCALQGYGGGWPSINRKAMGYVRAISVVRRRFVLLTQQKGDS